MCKPQCIVQTAMSVWPCSWTSIYFRGLRFHQCTPSKSSLSFSMNPVQHHNALEGLKLTCSPQTWRVIEFIGNFTHSLLQPSWKAEIILTEISPVHFEKTMHCLPIIVEGRGLGGGSDGIGLMLSAEQISFFFRSLCRLILFLASRVYINVSTLYIHIRCRIYGLFYRGQLKKTYENSTLWLCLIVNNMVWQKWWQINYMFVLQKYTSPAFCLVSIWNCLHPYHSIIF